MPAREALDDHERVVGEGGVQRGAELGLGPDLGDADGGAQARRLDEDGGAEHRQLAQHGVGLGVPAREPHARVGDLRHVGGGQDLFEDDLVHAQRRGEHARADVGHVEQLQQALQRPVLAERAVQHREDDVGAEQSAARAQRQLRALEEPVAAARSIVTGSTSWPAAATPSRTDAAEFSETSCSDERPPARTATLMASAWGSGTGTASASRRRRSPSRGRSSPSRRDERGVPAAGDWSLTRPTFAGSGRVRTCTLKPASSSVAVASASVGWSVVTSGTSGRALATVSSTAAPSSTRVPARRVLLHHRPGRLRRLLLGHVGGQPELVELRPRPRTAAARRAWAPRRPTRPC